MSLSVGGKRRPARVGLVAVVMFVLAMLAMPVLAQACEDEGPVITEATLTPPTLPTTGGTGTISAHVFDNCGVQHVIAEISANNGSFYVGFELVPSGDINTYNRFYKGQFDIPANFGEEPISYQGVINAESIEGNFVEEVAGEIEVAGTPPFDEAPYVSEASVTPTVWGGLGGTSRIVMRANDNRGISNAYAIVTLPSGREKEIPMEALSAEIFTALLPVPGNPGDSPRGYGVAVFAEDDIGQTTGVYAGNVTVEPKGTPNPGFLAMEPGYLTFGATTLGHTSIRTTVLRNTGKPGSPPVSGVLKSSEPQFVLPGLEEGGVPFTLAPGQERTFEIYFQPSLTGQQSGRLSVVREDGRQPNTGLSMFGYGIK
jgi:hypothetical protein